MPNFYVFPGGKVGGFQWFLNALSLNVNYSIIQVIFHRAG